jgi:hypothetical protein
VEPHRDQRRAPRGMITEAAAGQPLIHDFDATLPFTWTKDPDAVIAKATHARNRKTQQTSNTEH